jgi:membrane fusion protein, multidrug efflux system
MSSLNRLLTLSSATTSLLIAACAISTAQPSRHDSFVAIPETTGMTAEALSGRTEPSAILDVRPQVNGMLQDQLFTEGSQVAESQPLYQIDRAPYQAAYDGTNAQLQSAQADLARTKVAADRCSSLMKQHAISAQDYDNAQTAYKQAEAAVAQQLANLKLAQINLDNTTIRASISGRIAQSLVTRGTLVTAYQGSAIAVIQSLDPINIDIEETPSKFIRLKRAFSDSELKRDAPESARVLLVLDDGTTYSLKGNLRFDNVVYETEKNSVRMIAQFPNPTGLLVPGMNVRVRIIPNAKNPDSSKAEANVTKP